MIQLVPSFRRWKLVFILGVLATVLGVRAAHAQALTVTKTADTNDGSCTADCSLREAIVAANAAPGTDVVTIPAGMYVLGGAGGEDLAASGDLDLRESVTIVGAGTGVTVIDGGRADRIFDIVESATVTIFDLTLTHGRVPAGDTQGGGAILWGDPFSGRVLDLTLERVAIVDNDAGDGDGGGIRIDQEDPGSAVVRITDGVVADNTMADGDGGGLHFCCENLTATIQRTRITGNTAVEDPGRPGTNGEGGGVYHCCTDTALTLVHTTLDDNTGPTQGGGLFTCCGLESNAIVTVQRTSVSGNRALGPAARQGFGGGIEAEGGMSLVNSTVSGNQARQDGGGIESEDMLALRHVTIAGNSAARGAGLFEDGFGVALANTLLAGNLANGTPANCGAASGTDPLSSLGGNLSSDATCAFAGPGDRQSIDPLLSPLTDNGGPTATHALAAASPAVDGGLDAECLLFDQRGQSRPADGNGDGSALCDVGAFERGAVNEDCDNGVDDNGNGLVDCDDFDCAGQTICPERCSNCIDDDGDGAVDHADLNDCEPASDGGGAGVGDPVRAKLITACAASIRKMGAKLAATHLKTLQGCVDGLFACVQKKPGDARCLTKGGDGCRRKLAAVAAKSEKAEAAIVEACAGLTPLELGLATGLGYDGETLRCGQLGVPALADGAAVAACVAAEHVCAVQALVGTETPRTRELVALAGLDAAAVVPCVAGSTDGGGTGLGAGGKRAVACLQTLQKAGAKLGNGILKLGQTCVAAVFACRQNAPGDPRCLEKARAACPKAFAKITALEAALVSALERRCNVESPSLAELFGTAGAGFQSQASLCRALGVPALDSIAALGTCVVRHHRCVARHMLEIEVPRQQELLTDGGVGLP